MRFLFHLRWLLLAFGLGGQLPAYASHVMGGDIAYRPVAATTAGLPRYHVTIRLFVDPSGFDQTEVSLLATQGSCNAPTANSFRVNDIPRSSQTPGPLTCGGRLYAIALFETDVNLPSGKWALAVVSASRAYNISNISPSAGRTFYVSTTLDNSLTTQNSSPVFASNVLPVLTSTARPSFSFSAFDADGDSLAYAFALAQEVAGGLQAASGSSACPAPIAGSLSPHFALDSVTGALTRPVGSSTRQGYFVLAARVREYRRLNGQWQLLGTATRDVLYLVVAGGNEPPAFTTASVNGGPAQPPGQWVPARAGQTVQVTLTATDPDAGQLLSFSSNAPSLVPGLSLTTLSATQARLTWQVPAGQPLGRYTVPVAVSDNGCPYSASEDQSLLFVVATQATATRAAGPELSPAYPTPFREQVQFAAPAGQRVLVCDALGRLVARLTAGPDGLVRWLPASALPAGLYLARAADTGAPLARLLRAE